MRALLLLLLAAAPAIAADGADAGFQKADALTEAGDFAGARAALEAVSAKLKPADPRQVRYHERVGATLLREGKLKEARAAFSAALRTAQRLKSLGEDAARAYTGMGLCLRRAGDDRYAQRFFERALALKPDEGTRLFAEDQIHEIKGEPPAALP